MSPTTVTLSAFKRLNDIREGSHLVFSDAHDGLPMFTHFSALWEGAGMWDWLPVCWESSEPLKAFQECQHRLAARSLLNAYFSCLLRTGCARQAFIQRQRVFWTHEKKTQSFRCEWRDLRSRWLRGRKRKALREVGERPDQCMNAFLGPLYCRVWKDRLCPCLITRVHPYALLVDSSCIQGPP